MQWRQAGERMEPTKTEAGDRGVGLEDVEQLRRDLDEEKQRSLRLLADFEKHTRQTRARFDGIFDAEGT